MSVCLFVCLSVCLSVCLFVTSIRGQHLWEKRKTYSESEKRPDFKSVFKFRVVRTPEELEPIFYFLRKISIGREKTCCFFEFFAFIHERLDDKMVDSVRERPFLQIYEWK